MNQTVQYTSSTRPTKYKNHLARFTLEFLASSLLLAQITSNSEPESLNIQETLEPAELKRQRLLTTYHHGAFTLQQR